MNHSIRLALGLLCGLAIVPACSDDTGNSSNTSNTTNTNNSASMVTNTTDTNRTGSTGNTTDTSPTGDTTMTAPTSMCTNTTACGTDECGMVDRGACGMLDCGQCECDGGQLQGDTACGPCGLGTRSCEGVQQGKASCSFAGNEAMGLTDALDETQCQETLVYVEASSLQGGDGKMSNPYSSIKDALEGATPGQILVLSNARPYAETVNLKSGVHLLGGIKREGLIWQADQDTRSSISPDASQAASLGAAVMAKDLPEKTVLLAVAIAAPDSDGVNGFSPVVGLMARNSPDLAVLDSLVSSGAGHAGANGADGMPGADGGNGVKGANGRECWDRNRFYQKYYGTPELPFDYMTPHPAYGFGYFPIPMTHYLRLDFSLGGTSMCGVSGGQGGLGGCVKPYFDGSPASDEFILPEAGKGGLGVNGGVGGTGNFMEVTTPAPNGEDGRNGLVGQAAQAAKASGTWKVNAMDKLVWVSDGDGSDGNEGLSGGGGGGGGGQKYLFDRSNGPGILDDYYSWGPSGGGGGAGGCGGGGGGGGKSGGASFGIVLSKSSVDLRGTKVQAGLGGTGGNGGEGAIGGGGGRGATGGTTTLVWSDSTMGYVIASAQRIKPAGAGGIGGAGGTGSAGAGGAGGASVALYCIDSESSYAGDAEVELVSLGSAFGGGAWGEQMGQTEFQVKAKDVLRGGFEAVGF